MTFPLRRLFSRLRTAGLPTPAQNGEFDGCAVNKLKSYVVKIILGRKIHRRGYTRANETIRRSEHTKFMDKKKSRCKKMGYARSIPSDGEDFGARDDRDSMADLQKHINGMCIVAGLRSTEKIKRVKGPGRAEIESDRHNGVVLYKRNIHLYEDMPGEGSRSKSLLRDDFVAPEVFANIGSSTADMYYSNGRLERRWRMIQEESDGACGSSEPQECNAGASVAPIDEEKFKKNVLVTSLLKQHREKMNKDGRGGKCNFEAATKDRVDHKNVGGNSTNPHFIRDSIDSDFFYRETTVANSDVDFTVEHVGKINVTGPRKYLIESFKDEDIAFCRRKSRRSNSPRGKENK